MTHAGIIDTHLHLIYQNRLHYPWLAEFPRINRSFHLEEYRGQAAALGIERAVHMEAVVSKEEAADETDLVMGLGPPVVAAISGCHPEAEDFPATLDALAADTRVRGLRRILNLSPDALGLQPVFSENIRRLAARDLSFDLCVLGRQLPIAERIAKDCPQVRFILDHCGMPDIAAQALEPWREGIRRISELPNVVCKI
jgi:predicted TIM-barrel fold metal-dependent hydrolase